MTCSTLLVFGLAVVVWRNWRTNSFICGPGTSRPPMRVHMAAKPAISLRAEGESTLDKITGPKLFKSVKKLEGVHTVPVTLLRVASGVLMIHHGSEGGFWPANFGTPGFDGFVDFIVKPYFGFLPVHLHFGLQFMTMPSSGVVFFLLWGSLHVLQQ